MKRREALTSLAEDASVRVWWPATRASGAERLAADEDRQSLKVPERPEKGVGTTCATSLSTMTEW
jgi:hypothetical protein